MPRSKRTLVPAVLVLLAVARAGAGQTTVDAAIAFYEKGGAYCFRVVPEGVDLSEQEEWTFMVLTSADNGRNSFRVRSLDAGESGVRGSGLRGAGQAVTEVWKFERNRREFFQRFSDGIRAGRVRARITTADPPALARATSDRERAELYLAFADKGTRVSFGKSKNLSADEFLAFEGYLID